jgi:group I intron endonuclease
MAIYKALLKYGHQNFTLDILEYCEPGLLISKEQHYIDKFKPEYNLNPKPGSSLGYKHTEETLEKMKDLKASLETRIKLAAAAKGRILSEKARAKISIARLGIKLSAETRAKLSLASSLNIGKAVKVVNTNTQNIQRFSTITEAAAAINVTRTTIAKAIKSGKKIKNIYEVFLVNK